MFGVGRGKRLIHFCDLGSIEGKDRQQQCNDYPGSECPDDNVLPSATGFAARRNIFMMFGQRRHVFAFVI